MGFLVFFFFYPGNIHWENPIAITKVYFLNVFLKEKIMEIAPGEMYIKKNIKGEDFMPYATFQNDRDYLLNKYRTLQLDPATGMDPDELQKGVMEELKNYSNAPRKTVKAELFAWVCRNMRIGVSPHDYFPAFPFLVRTNRPLRNVLSLWAGESIREEDRKIFEDNSRRNAAGFSTVWRDYDHAVPDYDAVISLGFTGLKERAETYRKEREAAGKLDEGSRDYFDSIRITFQAILDTIDRFILLLEKEEKKISSPRLFRQKKALEKLRKGPPETFYEVLLLNYLYFMFGEYIDHMQVRSLGNLDQDLYPFYCRDLAEKRLTEEEVRELLGCYFMQWGSINNYWGQPVYFGGTGEKGNSLYNELSYILLDVYDKLEITSPKLQLKVAANTPEKLLYTAFEMIRKRHRSIVFVSEEGMKRVLKNVGCSEEEARTCHVSGCYEFAPKGKSNCTGGGHINLLKGVELVFHNGVDAATSYASTVKGIDWKDLKDFEAFYQAYYAYTKEITEKVLAIALAEEKNMDSINPGGMFSSTITNSLRTALDAFSYGCIYRNTGILLSGLGTAVDALMAVKKFVYDEKLLTLAQLKEMLDADWVGYEKWRLKALHAKEKYGNGIPEVDLWAGRIIKDVTSLINGRPNARGGVFQASGHNAKQFIEQGKLTAATPDGRKAGSEFSKNLSPTMGMDRNGVTALLRSIGTLDSLDLPGDFPLDVMLHPTTVQGEKGLEVMKSVIFDFFRRNGLAIHFNIVDAGILQDAKRNPEKYENLQIRVCGWNVRFRDLPEKEQDAYIERALHIGE